MASTSTSSCYSGCEPENEHANASEGIDLSPSTSATPSLGTLFSSCFSWFSCLLSLCSSQSHSAPSISTSRTRVRNDCQGITPSPSTTRAFEQVTPSPSTMHAFEQVTPSPSTSGRSTMMEREVPYDVFINHRGPDVKEGLATHLYEILTGKGLRVFLDKEDLELGDFLPAKIQGAMHSASLHIAIFSKNYAESPWCLAELSFMLKTGTQIVPVFYHIEPSDIRHAKGLYAEAFSEHKKKGRYTSEKLQEWKNALNNVSHYVGVIIRNEDDEGSLLKDIVSHVLKIIKNDPFVVSKHPIGLEETVMDFERTMLQSAESYPTVQIVGIWGMGGSGKTTFAKQLYNNKYKTMEKSSFLLDIRDAASNSALHIKQKKLLEDLGLRGLSIDNVEEGKGILANRLRSVRVLIILDDVDNEDQLDALVPNKDSLGSGSLILVTTRELEVLQRWGISSIYKMKLLDPHHAKQLFCWHAFLKPSPLQQFEDLVEDFLHACNGLPLSLKIFGAQLYGKSSKDYWKDEYCKISRILHKDIRDRLKISYDALDDEEKQIFLDTACFFIGQRKDLAIAAWDGSGWNGLHNCRRLVNKCLIELGDGNCIRMHDHLRDLGREIANCQSPYRIWSTQQIINVENEVQRIGIRGIMTTTIGSRGQVEGFPLYYRGRKIRFNTNRGYYNLTPSLIGMKILHVRGNYYNQVIADISEDLIWLRWFGIKRKNLDSLGSMKNLRVLEFYENLFSNNQLEELWMADSDAPVQLRELVISECYNFRRFPKSIGCLKNLKIIMLRNILGNQIRSLPKEFCLLQSLEHLELSGCQLLSSLPKNCGHLRNLRHLDLSYCENLTRLPVSFKELTLLQHLNLQGCSKLTLASDILENIRKLEYLNLSDCKQLEEMPRHFTNQASLTNLHLGGMCRLREIPMNISQLSKLQVMMIGSDLLTCLPTSLGDLSSLTSLVIEKCPKLQCIPDSLGHLSLLQSLEIANSGVKSLSESVMQLNNLQRLSIFGCPICQFDLHAASFASSLCSLKVIQLVKTELSKISIVENCCPALETISIEYNEHLTEIEVLPSTVKNIRLSNCKMVRSISGVGGLLNLQWLMITGCPELDVLPSFVQLTSLRVFELKGCYRVKKIQGLEHCRALEELTAETMWEEAGIESLECMERLRMLKLTAICRSGVEGCIQSMKRWPHEIVICTRAVSIAGLLEICACPNLSVSDLDGDQNINFNAHGILVCFVVNCKSPNMVLSLEGDKEEISSMEVEKGIWLWIALFSQGSRWHTTKKYQIGASPSAFSSQEELATSRTGMLTISGMHRLREGRMTIFRLPLVLDRTGISILSDCDTTEVRISANPSYEVERELVMMGEVEKLGEAFIYLWQLLSN